MLGGSILNSSSKSLRTLVALSRFRPRHHVMTFNYPTFVRFNSTTSSPAKPKNFGQRSKLRMSLNHFIQDLAIQPVPTVTLDDLLHFKGSVGKSRDEVLLENANDTLNDLFILVGRGIKRFSSLPYIVMMNPHMAKIYQCYTDTLKLLLNFVSSFKGKDYEVNLYDVFDDLSCFSLGNPKDNDKVIPLLEKILAIHTDNTVDLREAFDEIAPGSVDEKAFLDEHMSERILMRLLINHHLLLCQQLKSKDADISSLRNVGAIDMDLNVLEVIQHSYDYVSDMAAMKYADCIGMEVETVVIKRDGSVEKQKMDDIDDLSKCKPVIFPYVTSHIEYVLDEIFKNTTRASMDNAISTPFKVLLLLTEPADLEDCYKLELRVTDRAKGIKPSVVDHIFDYSFTTVDEEEEEDNAKVLTNTNDNIIAGMGYGLPMSLTYTRMFDGDIQLKSVYGNGTTVYLKWTGVSRQMC